MQTHRPPTHQLSAADQLTSAFGQLQVPMKRRGTVNEHCGASPPFNAATIAWHSLHVASAGCAWLDASTFVRRRLLVLLRDEVAEC